ncbi:50S ribosomal protein L20 [Candidatus Kuenenbacteria bacterium HGW-Kuenenbacteria-1]|uniref:Large ribosomal subunit protein bL20 n=1 Tax=Candidatus Kuenenbacteria bacterium HGW-Kuenenbacteria-1 TaxID=2013812 RepID=A0A2N1UNE6_9BACT|nr:MAG: 50S ribosomal protein L20 [Candidatus Kuenenbacteria bacterium HGW-Kuenenbacteria-1]
MPRVKRGVGHTKHRKNILKQTKGYKWGRKNLIKLAKTAINKAGVYAYRDRRVKKRTFRGLWQIRIGIATKKLGLSYSKFIDFLKKNKVELDRKILSDLSQNHFEIFTKIVEKVTKK